MAHLVTQFQGQSRQILRAAANNRVRGHASVCGYAPPPFPYISFRDEGVGGPHGEGEFGYGYGWMSTGDFSMVTIIGL